MDKKINILLAEDDTNLGYLLHTFLKSKGMTVSLANNGKTALEKFVSGKFDFCILDVMMPSMDGFTLAREIRAVDKKIPVLFLTAKSLSTDKLEGFNIGADDYMTKPFQMEELLARINAILRRTVTSEQQENKIIQIGRYQYQPEMRLLFINDEQRKLTTKENQLLLLLVKNMNDILDRQATLKAIWGDDNYFTGRTMDVYVAKLRKILKDDERLEILNIHGKGFKLIAK